MSGLGPAPKQQGQRRRRNAPERGDWIDLAPLENPVLPTLPARGRGAGAWQRRTRAMWNAWRLDPATAMFGPAEVAACVELAWLHHDAILGKQKMAEIRLRMDGLGLTAKGKRDLRWRTPSEIAVAPTPLRPEQPTAARRLRAVDSSAIASLSRAMARP